jgi:tetratricopeptide (TPR) repeat protein
MAGFVLCFPQSFLLMLATKMALKMTSLSFLLLFLLQRSSFAQDSAFTNSLIQAGVAEKHGDLQQALKIYEASQSAQAGNASNLCVLSRLYCDLTYLTNSPVVQKELVNRALVCARQATQSDPTNATAHASLAVCYAKSCNYVDIKTQLTYSRLFKEEAEKSIVLDPKQDVAYYLLGRWNYAIAGAGFFSRAYVKVVYGGLPQASFADAVREFQKACEVAPNRILNHAGLAMAYDAMGDKKSEIAELKKCCILKPLGPEDRDARTDAEKKLAALQP